MFCDVFFDNFCDVFFYNFFDDFDEDYLKDEDGLESIVFRIFKEYIKSNLNEFYDYNQFIEIINYKNYLHKKLYK